MTIDWLFELEQDIENGKEVLACPGVGRHQWIIGKPIEELRKLAKRSADNRKMQARIVRLISKHDAIAGDNFLVPTRIDDPGSRGEPQIQWTVVETKEAAEMMKDVRKGSSPFFGIQDEETVEPTLTENE